LNEAGIDKHLAHRARKAAKQGRNVTPETKAAAIKMVFEQGKTKKEAEKATGITDIPMRRILATEKGRREGAIIDATTLSATSQEKLAAAIRQHTRELEREFEGRVQAESWKRLNEMTLPFYLKEIERIENIITSRKGHMSAAQYTKIWSCLHPDRIDDEGLKKKFAEAFDIFSRLKPLLVSEEEHRIVAPDLPRTTAEWMAKKNEWMARKQKKA
jgi:transposase-like protein